MNADPFEDEVRAMVRGLAPRDVPSSLRDHLAALHDAERRRPAQRLAGRMRLPSGWPERLAAAGIAAIGLLVLAVGLASLVVLYSGATTSSGPGSATKALVWQTDVASLEADRLVIETAGQAFVGSRPFQVRSDPGSPEYRTLEVEWREHGVEMRLYVYFAADETHWWVSEMRVYDGRPRGEWVTFRGPMFRTERGSSYSGDINLEGRNERGPARLRVEGVELTAFAPGTGPRPFSNCRFVPADEPNVDPVEAGLHGLRLGMDAREAHAALTQRGICHDFRFSLRYGDGAGYSQRWCVPPPGTVSSGGYGGEGEIILFVDDPTPRTPDPGIRPTVGCN